MGLDWSSSATRSIFRPSIPPWALTASKYAFAPYSESLKVDEALPVREVMKPTLTESAVTPGALAGVRAGARGAVEAVGAAVVALDDGLLELLEHAPARSAEAATAATNRYVRGLDIPPPSLSESQNCAVSLEALSSRPGRVESHRTKADSPWNPGRERMGT